MDTASPPPFKEENKVHSNEMPVAPHRTNMLSTSMPVRVDITLYITDVDIKYITRHSVTVTMVMSRQNAALAIRGQATDSWATLSKSVPSLFRPR